VKVVKNPMPNDICISRTGTNWWTSESVHRSLLNQQKETTTNSATNNSKEKQKIFYVYISM